MEEKMTREECEFKLLEKWKEMVEIYKQYNGDATYLTVFFMKDKDGICLNINDDYYDHEESGIYLHIKDKE